MRALLAVALVVGCSKPAPIVTPPEAGPVASATVVVVDAAPPVPPPKVYRASYAKLSHGVLDECAEFTYTGELDAGKDDPDEAWAKMVKPKDKDLVVIRKGCAAQFADRQVLASCKVSQKSKDGETVEVASYRYAFEDIGLSDSAMKECLNMKGEWDSISRDSPEWSRAKLEHAQRKLHKLTDP